MTKLKFWFYCLLDVNKLLNLTMGSLPHLQDGGKKIFLYAYSEY